MNTGCYQIDHNHEVRLPACCANCRSRRITSYGYEGCGCGQDGPDGEMLPEDRIEEMPPNWVCSWWRNADGERRGIPRPLDHFVGEGV